MCGGRGDLHRRGETVNIALSPPTARLRVPPARSQCTTNAAGECSATFTSATTGTVTGRASSTFAVAGSPSFTVATDGSGGNSRPATKTWVDARLSIAAAGTSRVGSTGLFKAKLEKRLAT